MDGQIVKTGINRSLTERIISIILHDNAYFSEEDVTVRSMFGYAGIFIKNKQLIIIKDENVYLKLADEPKKDNLVVRKGERAKSSLDYYLFDYNSSEFKEAIIKSFLYFVHTPSSRTYSSITEKRIKDMPNMRLVHERAFYKIGISTPDELKKMGAVRAYRELIINSALKNIREDFYLCIEGAITGVHSSQISRERAEEIKSLI